MYWQASISIIMKFANVRMVPICDLASYGFTDTFKEIIESGFPGAGSYMGHKRNIGL
ncbi:hypothetical protein ACFQ88_25280 [Paenibacillus sp. NPDC056579]|uniref:hypothetical protein n=1 Tax=Paenibacillus sp. NPDC056579 TaxID=3345871 RepID=UPI0036BEB38B